MELEKFISDIASQFDDTDRSVFTADTRFKTLDEWSSLTALALIGVIDEEYDIVLKGDDIRQADTIEELFQIVQSKL